MVLTVLTGWVVLAVLSAVFFAAVGKSGLREEQALGHLPIRCGNIGRRGRISGETHRAAWASHDPVTARIESLVAEGRGEDAPGMTGDTALLDRIGRDADRVVLCRCGGFGRVTHAAVNGPGEPERYMRSTFTCTWQRPGPHEPLLAPRGL